MSLKTVTADLKTYIKNNFPDCSGRVYAVPSRVSFLLMENYQVPGVAIIYTGGNRKLQKRDPVSGQGKIFDKHTFDILIFQTIWKEECVVEGLGEQKGLLEMLESLTDKLDGYTWGNVFCTMINDNYGTEDYPELGASGLSASIGFKLEVWEQKQ